MFKDVLQGCIMALSSLIWASQLWRTGVTIQEEYGERFTMHQ